MSEDRYEEILEEGRALAQTGGPEEKASKKLLLHRTEVNIDLIRTIKKLDSQNSELQRRVLNLVRIGALLTLATIVPIIKPVYFLF